MNRRYKRGVQVANLNPLCNLKSVVAKGIIHEQKRNRLPQTPSLDIQGRSTGASQDDDSRTGRVGKTPPPDVQMEILETIYTGSHSLKGLPVLSICQISKQSVSLSKVYFRYGSRKR